MATTTTLEGWTPESSGRGTWKILWSCLSTIALAVWICYHPPADWGRKRSWVWYSLRGLMPQGAIRFVDILFGLLVPEFYIFLGFYQLVEARSCRKSVQRRSKQGFTLREAFFITMGGYHAVIPQSCLQSRDSELDEQTRVLRLAHILWLLDAGVLDLPAKNHLDVGFFDIASGAFRNEAEKAAEDVADAEQGSARNIPLQMVDSTRLADQESACSTRLQTADTTLPVNQESARSTHSPVVEAIGPAEDGSASITSLPTAQTIESENLDDIEEPGGWLVNCLGNCLKFLLAYCFMWTLVKPALETEDDSTITSTTNTRDPPQALLTSGEVIKDRSHSDGAAKFIVVLQCVWFLVNCVGRGAHNLPLSLLEVVTLVYIVFTLGAYALWWEKPQGLKVITEFTPQLEDSQWKELAALNSTDYFVNNAHGVENKANKWLLGLLGWEYFLEDIYSEKSKRSVWFVFCVASWSSAALHCIGWNAEFPSVAERTAWRAFVILLFVTPLPTVADSRLLFHKRGHFTSMRFRGWLQVVGVLLAAMSKLGILILAFISLRAAPAAIYDTWEIANWVLFWL